MKNFFVKGLSFLLYGYVLPIYIHLHEVKQDDCMTECTKGLISGFDIAVFFSEVNITDDPDAKNVYFQIQERNKTYFKTECSVDLTKDCNSIAVRWPCNCKAKTSHIFIISFSHKVLEKHNGAKVRGTVIRSQNDSEHVRSEVREFPAIYASNSTTGEMMINKKPIEYQDIMVKRLKAHELLVEFACSGSGIPCVIEISANNSNYKVQGKERAIFYKSYNRSEIMTLTVRHALCRFTGNMTNSTLEIHLEYEISSTQDISPGYTLLFLIMVIPIFVILTYAWLRTRSKKRESEENAADGGHNNEDIELNSLNTTEANPLINVVDATNTESLGKHHADNEEIINTLVQKIAEDTEHDANIPPLFKQYGYTARPTIEMPSTDMTDYDTNLTYDADSKKDIGERRASAQYSAVDNNALSRYDDVKSLVSAAEEGCVDQARGLLSGGANVNEQNHHGYTALMSAAKKGNINMVKLLLEHQADVNIKANNGYTALMCASYYDGRIDIAKLFIERGADINSTEENGWTALMIASQRGNFDVAESLIRKGATVNTQNKKGETALMFSASNGHFNIAKVLIENKAEVHMENKDGKTALSFADESGHRIIFEFLLGNDEEKNTQAS